MKIRGLKFSDIPKVEDIYHRYYENEFPFPQRSDSISDVVITDEDNVVGFGTLQLMVEPVMIFDKNLSKRKKVIILKNLLEVAIVKARLAKITQMVISTSDQDFINILKKHFNFSEASSKSLVLNL